MAFNVTRPGSAISSTIASLPENPSHPAHGESALPQDKQKETIVNLEDGWENDPLNARNWNFSQKWTTVAIVSMYTFISPLSSSMMAPGLPEVAEKYHITNDATLGLTLSIYLLSFALGPLILAPLSEIYGRTWVYHLSNIFSTGFTLGCALAPTAHSFIGFRFLAGFSGSAPIACGSGSIGDLFSERDRASAMAVYTLGPLIGRLPLYFHRRLTGPVIGPIAGGFIAQTIGIKYVFIVITALSGLETIIAIPLLRETYAPVIRLRRAKREGDSETLTQLPHVAYVHGGKWKFLWDNLTRPLLVLTRSFICFVLSLYMAFLYGQSTALPRRYLMSISFELGIYYLMFATFADLFKKVYGFKTGPGGLAYIGLGLGFFSAAIFGAKTADQVYKHLANKNGGVGKPEMRIPALFFGSLFVPIGLLWYGWSAQARVHWIMPIIGTGIFGFGMMSSFLPIMLYLVDAFQFAASATAAASVFRSFFGFVFPLFGHQMFVALGVGGGNSLLAGLAIFLGIPFPVWIYYKGESIRLRSKMRF